jgi:hypothetical protein
MAAMGRNAAVAAMSPSPPFEIKDFDGEDTAATGTGPIFSHPLPP